MADFDVGPHANLQVPPDSTGKRLNLELLIAVQYASGTIAFLSGDEVTGATSGTAGTIVSVKAGSSTAAGTIYVVPLQSSVSQAFTVGEPLQVDAVTNAVVSSTLDAYTPASILVSSDNPRVGQRIDSAGASYVRFSDGAQLLTAFGVSKVGMEEQLASYTHYYDEEADEWSTNLTGTASLTFLSNESSVALDVGTANGEIAERTTDRYHVYQAGYGQSIKMALGTGVFGKANVRWRWGYFDSDNGLFFELNGTALRVVVRSKTSGSVVDTVVGQQDWNGDQLDGVGGPSNLSGVTIDTSKLNVYWIDFGWLGSGRVRFGVFNQDGERIVCHSVGHPNSLTVPYMSTPTLPLRYSVENTGVAASPSRIRLTCCEVSIEGKMLESLKRRSYKWSVKDGAAVTCGATQVPLLSFRPKTTINGIRNSKQTIGEKIQVYVKAQPMILRILADATPTTGVSWISVDPDSAVEYDHTATAFTGGRELLAWYLGVGTHNLEFPPNFGLQGIAMRLLANGSQTNSYVFTGESLEGATTSDALMGVTGIDL